MRFLYFFKKFQQWITSKTEDRNDAYLPLLWENDYCQIEITPLENKEFILSTIQQINNYPKGPTIDFGFTEIFGIDPMPITTFSKEIRTDYLTTLLTSHQFEKAKSIEYDGHKILDCETEPTKAYGFSNFTVFFDTDDECVKNIWLSVNPFISMEEYDRIKSALYYLGEECEMILVDWNRLELFNLRDKREIDEYLLAYWK